MIILSAKIHLDRGWVASLKVTITQTFTAGVTRAGRFPELSLGETCNETAAVRLVSPAARRHPAGGRAGRRARRPRLLRCPRPRHSWAGEHTTPPGSPAWPRGGICPRDSVSALADFADNYEKTIQFHFQIKAEML